MQILGLLGMYFDTGLVEVMKNIILFRLALAITVCSNILDVRNLQEQVENGILLPKIVLTFHCLNKLF